MAIQNSIEAFFPLTLKKNKKFNYDFVYTYWRKVLYNKIINMFNWTGFDFPQKEIELITLSRGFSAIVKQHGKIFVTDGSIFGVTEYIDEATHFTFTNPKLGSGIREINKDCVIINNTSLRMDMIQFIERYACMLAHADLSLQAVLINSRTSGVLTAPNTQVKNSITTWYNSLVDGYTMAIVDEQSLESLVNAEGLRNISTQYPASTDIKDFVEVQANIIKQFFNEIGIRVSTEKRERLITDEVNSDESMLIFNIDDMLKQRQDACKKINEIFGLNVSVTSNIKNLITSKGGTENDNI